MIKIFEGRVTFVAPIYPYTVDPDNRQVTGLIKAVDPPGRSMVTLDFNLRGVPPEDRHLVVEGARFYYMTNEDTGDSSITVFRPRPTVISVGTAHEHSTAEPT